MVMRHEGKMMTTSLLVAEQFGKRHDDVLRDIAKLDCSTGFRARNFELSAYELKGKSQAMQRMTREGFTLLSMSFNGKKVIKCREDFIRQFDDMEAELRHENAAGLLDSYPRRTADERMKNVPRGYWCIFDQFHYVLLLFENGEDSQDNFLKTEERVKKAWNVYRKQLDFFKFSYTRTFVYEDVFKGQKLNKECICYLSKELPLFISWLTDVYKKEELRKHLYGKFAGNGAVLAKIDVAFPKQIAD